MTLRDERLFVFVRASDGMPMAVDLRFNGESHGWEVRLIELLEDVEEAVLFTSRGGFVTKAAAVQWAEEQRKESAT